MFFSSFSLSCYFVSNEKAFWTKNTWLLYVCYNRRFTRLRKKWKKANLTNTFLFCSDFRVCMPDQYKLKIEWQKKNSFTKYEEKKHFLCKFCWFFCVGCFLRFFFWVYWFHLFQEKYFSSNEAKEGIFFYSHDTYSIDFENSQQKKKKWERKNKKKLWHASKLCHIRKNQQRKEIRSKK